MSSPLLAADSLSHSVDSWLSRSKPIRIDIVGQEIIDRSTTPVLTDDGVEPWYVGLRAYLVSKEDRFEILPGGLARVSPDADSLNFTMTAGERSQDVWVLSDKPVQHMSLLDSPSTLIEPRRSGSELPSRVADNFFWLGRYTERAEQTARLVKTLSASLESEDTDGPENIPLLRTLASQGQIDPDYVVPELSRTVSDAISVLPEVVLDRQRPMSLMTSVENTIRTAVRVRDRISHDMWRSIDRLNDHIQFAAHNRNVESVDMMVLLEGTLADLSAFTGVTSEGMTRALGWRFLDLGRRIERSWQTATLLRSFFATDENDDPDTVEALLTVTDTLMTYRNRYLATFQIPVVLDLLLADTTNPRSIIYQLTRINEHLEAMPGNQPDSLLNPERKLALSLANTVRLADVYELSATNSDGARDRLVKVLKRLIDQLPKLSDAVSSRFLIHAGLPRHFGSSETTSVVNPGS